MQVGKGENAYWLDLEEVAQAPSPRVAKDAVSAYSSARMSAKPDDEGLATAISPLSVAAPSRQTRIFLVHVVTGPETGKTFAIDVGRGGRVLLGQSPACAV